MKTMRLLILALLAALLMTGCISHIGSEPTMPGPTPAPSAADAPSMLPPPPASAAPEAPQETAQNTPDQTLTTPGASAAGTPSPAVPQATATSIPDETLILRPDDFIIEVAGGKLDLISQGTRELEVLTGQKMEPSSISFDDQFYMVVDDITFAAYDQEDAVIRTMTIRAGSGFKTARGIGIASYWKDVLEAYGDPVYEDERMTDAYIGYFNPMDFEPVDGDYTAHELSRTLSYYAIFIEFDDTMNVEEIVICDNWGG